MTETTEFAGLADRIKTFVNGYILAQENNRSLFIYHDKGFELQKYLEPNQIDWRISPAEICWGLNRVKLLWFDQFSLSLQKKNKEYHGYALYADVFSSLTPELLEKYAFSRIFHTLFRPSPHLAQLISAAMNSCQLIENQYIAVHLRFLNFFEPVEKQAVSATGTPEQQEQMIRDIHATIDDLRKKSDCNTVLLFSDSNKFLQAPHPSYIKVLPGSVGHISRNNGHDAITDKAFTDLFVMGKAKCIYRILGNHIYPGGFAQTAARIAEKECIDVTYTSSI